MIPPDDLYGAAYRLARLYAILSPRILMRELRVERAHAERLLARLEADGAVGPTIITGTGARESRVNVVEDRAPDAETMTLHGTNPALGRRAIAYAAAGALLGLTLMALAASFGLGTALSRWFHAEQGSPLLAELIGALVPVIGLPIGWLAEYPLRTEEDLVPYWALRIRQAIWTGAVLAAFAAVTLRLLA